MHSYYIDICALVHIFSKYLPAKCSKIYHYRSYTGRQYGINLTETGYKQGVNILDTAYTNYKFEDKLKQKQRLTYL